MATPQDTLLDWLRDAHAMEQQAGQMLTGMARRIENYPQLKTQIERHIEETRNHANLVQQCIDRSGSSTSTVKDIIGKVTGLGQALSGLFVSDEIVKGALAGYSFEHIEIASYEILIAAANEAGDMETKRICEGILQEEKAMASWLAQHLPELTREFLRRDAAPGATAKH
jgi:ferritin-like metal-binding protein YciE